MKGKTLRWISITLSALLLTGSVLSITADNNSVIYAAKKRTEKEKKANKLPKKKITKKPVKKTTKKKVIKKPVKKTTKKKVVKKPVKKTTKKKPVKKLVKKTTKKKPVKKLVKKSTKKKVVKKPVKNTTKKPIKKNITMAEKYPPLVTKDAINIPWGTVISWHDGQGEYDLANCITNRDKLNSYISQCKLEDENSVDFTHGGIYQARIVVDYRDGSTYITDPVTFNVSTADADKYEPTYKTDIYLSHDDVNLSDNTEKIIRNTILTNADGYFPNEDAQFNRTKFYVVEKNIPILGYLWDSYHWLPYSNTELSSTTGIHEYCIKIMYPDHSYYITKPIKIHVKPYQSEEYLPILKNELVLKKDQQVDENALKSLFSNANSLPKETRFLLTDGWLDTSVVGKQKTAIKVEYPDGSSYITPQVAIYVK